MNIISLNIGVTQCIFFLGYSSKVLHEAHYMITNIIMNYFFSIIIYSCNHVYMYLYDGFFKLLTEQRTVCEETTCSGSCTGKFCLLFEDVHKDVFEPVLRHIYTGDVSMLNINELDGIAKLAER